MFKYSVSKFFNYIQKDYIIDWLNIHGSKYGFKKQRKNTFFMDSGNQLETKVKDILFADFSVNEKVDLSQFLFKNFTHKSQTQKYLSSPTIKCIYQGLVTDDTFYGITDFITKQSVIQSWMNKYSNKETPSQSVADDESFSVVDIKSSCKIVDGKVSRSTRNYEWLQFQLSMYTELLSSYNINITKKAYIMSYKNDNIVMGEIDLIDIDKNELLKYAETMANDSSTWKLFPRPSNDYLYPNMKNDYDEEWRIAKRDIAEKIGEWTLLPYFGMKNRNEMWKKGFKSFKEKGILSKLKEQNIDVDNKNMIEVNQEGVFSESRNGDVVRKIVEEKINSDKVLYIDIETIYYNFSFHPFMACVYTSFDKEYITIMCEDISEIENKKIKTHVSDLLKNYTDKYGKIKVVHYAGNEGTLFEKNDDVEYINLYTILKESDFAITGLYSLKLKEIYKVIARNKEETNITNGYDAMVIGNKYYSSTETDEKINYKNDLKKYIKRDVDILVKIVKYFQRY